MRQVVDTIFITNNHSVWIVVKEIFGKISEISRILRRQLYVSEMAPMGHGVCVFIQNMFEYVKKFLWKFYGPDFNQNFQTTLKFSFEGRRPRGLWAYFVKEQWLRFHIWFIMTLYYKMRQLFYYKMRPFYCKMLQFRYKMQQLLQNETFIANCVGQSQAVFEELESFFCRC